MLQRAGKFTSGIATGNPFDRARSRAPGSASPSASTAPSSFAAARQRHPAFSKLESIFGRASGASARNASATRFAFMRTPPQQGLGWQPHVDFGFASRGNLATGSIDHVSVASRNFQHMLHPTHSSAPTAFENAAQGMLARISTMMEQLLQRAMRHFAQSAARQAAAQQSYTPQFQPNRQDHYSQPARQPQKPAAASARTAPPPDPAMSIKKQRDSAGWSAYVQDLKKVHGWTDAHVAGWLTDFKQYIKFGDEKAAAAFNGKYGHILQAKVEDGDLRTQYVKLMKAMQASLKSPAATPPVA
jgi:hypothetical protein